MMDAAVTVMLSPRMMVLLFGQLISFLYASEGALQSSLQVECGLSAPAFISGLLYFCLSFLLVPVYWSRRQGQGHHEVLPSSVIDGDDSDDNRLNQSVVRFEQYKHSFCGIPLEGAVWAYAMMGLVDLEAYYFSILAFRYTILTSATILSSIATPSAMIFSRILLKRRYTCPHLLGACLCVAGAAVNVWMDSETVDDAEFPDKFRGDVYAILGGCLFGLSDVVCENAVQQLGGVHEYLGMAGLFGAIFASMQAVILERDDIMKFLDQDLEGSCSYLQSLPLLAGSVLVGAASYYSSVCFLEVSESALLNLSMLTMNVWTAVFSIVVQKIFPKSLFYVGVLLIVSGVTLYNTAPSPIVDEDTIVSEDTSDDCLEMEALKSVKYSKTDLEEDETCSDSDSGTCLDESSSNEKRIRLEST